MAYEQCLICGVKKSFSIYPTCKQDAKLFGIPIVENIDAFHKTKTHSWSWHGDKTMFEIRKEDGPLEWGIK